MTATPHPPALDRRRRPPPGAARPFRFPPFARHRLDNGLEVLAARWPKQPLIRMDLLAPGGAIHDPAGQAGLATLTATLLDEGTRGSTATELAEALGGNLNTGATWNTAVVNTTQLAKHRAKALELLAQVALRASFPEAEVERLRSQRLANLMQRRHDPRLLAESYFGRAIYRSGPYSQPLFGDPKSVAGLERVDMVAFYDRHYVARGARLIAVGDLEPDELFELVPDYLGTTDDRPLAPLPDLLAPPLEGLEIHLVDRPGTPQAELRMGQSLVEYSHPDYSLLELMSSILGGKFTSRINLNLRERHGYTYGAQSRLVGRLGQGPFQIATAVSIPHTGDAIRELLHELRRIREDKVTREELEDTRRFLMGNFLVQLQTIEELINRLSTVAIFELPPDHFESHLMRIETASRDDVQRVAREYLDPDRVVVVVVGPAAALQPQLEDLGPVTLWPLGQRPL